MCTEYMHADTNGRMFLQWRVNSFAGQSFKVMLLNLGGQEDPFISKKKSIFLAEV